MSEVVGRWTGKEEFDEILVAIEANPPRQHRLSPIPGLLFSEASSDKGERTEITPSGTQNPYPPGSGAPFLPNNPRMIIPAMLSGYDPATPTPGGAT